MRHLITLALLGLGFGGCRSLGADSEVKLVGGEPVEGEVFPSVFIWTSNDSDLSASYCTGTKIGPGLILTAAHCVLEQTPAEGQVYLGPWRNRVALAPGNDITYSFARSLAPRDARVERAKILTVKIPEQVEGCVARPEVDPLLCQYRAPLPDVAVIVIEELTGGSFAQAPASKISAVVAGPGSAVTVCGYGSEGGEASAAPRLKFAALRTASKDALYAALAGTDAERDGFPDLSYYFGVVSPVEARRHVNLGSGDSGGPVFLTASKEVVGVNSDGFCPLEEPDCEITNNSTFARLDGAAPGDVAAWLAGILSK